MPATSPADWYADPFERHDARYWDGRMWTDRVLSRGREAVDPPVGAPPVPVVTSQPLAGWYPDPSGRHERRYWDGGRWTEYVLSGGRNGIDPLAEAPRHSAAGWTSKKVERQVRQVGAPASEPGGGTLFTEPVLVVNQKVKPLGSSLGYAIFDQHGRQLGMVREVRRDLVTKARDTFVGQCHETRKYRLEVVDMEGQVLLAMTRPEMWFTAKSKMTVEAPDGTTLGQVTQETLGLVGGLATISHAGVSSAGAIAGAGIGLVAGMTLGKAASDAFGKTIGKAAGKAVGHRAAVVAFGVAERSGVPDRLSSAVEGLDRVGHVRFGLEAGGQRLGSIHAESIQQWDFRVEDPSGAEIARITKTWSGWTKERFTKADHYVVLLHRQLEGPLHCLVVSAAVAIDIALKEGDPTSGSRKHRHYQ